MTVENDDKAIAPETMNLENGDMMLNVEPEVGEATDNEANETINSKVIAPEDMKLETGVIMIDVEPPAIEASDSECGIVDEEVTEQLEESCGSSFKEEGDNSRGKSDIQEDILVQSSSTKEFDVANGQLRKKSALVVVGSNHKFNVRSRYLSDSFASCHDFCKFGHKHESEKKTRRLSLGTIRESKPLIKTPSDDSEKPKLEKMTKKKEIHRRLSHPGIIPEKAPAMHLGDKNLPSDVNQSKIKSVQSERRPSLVQSPKSSARSKAATQAVKKIATQSPSLQKTSTSKLKKVPTPNEVGSNSKGEMEVNEKEPACSSSATSQNNERGYSEDVNEIKAREPMSDSPKTTVKSGYRKGVKDIKAKEPMGNSVKASLKRSPSLKARLYKNRRSSLNSRTQNDSGEHKVDGHDDTIEANSKNEPAEKTSKAKEPMGNSVKGSLKRSPSLKARLYKNRKSSLNSRTQNDSGEHKVDEHDDTIETNSNNEPAEKTSKATICGENSQHSSLEPRSRKSQGSKGNQKGIAASLLSFSSRGYSKTHREKLGSEVSKNKQVGFKTEASGSKTSTPKEKVTATRQLRSVNSKNTKQIDIIRDDSRSRTSTPREKSMVEQKWKPKRKEKSNVEEKDASAWKVKFKRGTVVALQVANNAPKRLQFRRARTLRDDQIPKSATDRQLKNEHVMVALQVANNAPKRLKFRRARTLSEDAKSGTDRQLKNEHVMHNELHDKIGPEKVRLRHQEASEKKDDVDLNNVIEETASKLVKTRKSKVKALVGAFETVMSLGDRKRLVETGAS